RAPCRAGPVMSLSGLWQLAQFPLKSFSPAAYNAASSAAIAGEREKARSSAMETWRSPVKCAETLAGRGIPDVLDGTTHRWSGRKNKRSREPGRAKREGCHEDVII